MNPPAMLRMALPPLGRGGTMKGVIGLTDGVQSGAGNAYTLQTVANALALYPTYEDYIRALASGQVFVDLKINPPGWDVLGTSLNKVNLLKDETAGLYGLTGEAVPDDVLNKIGTDISALKSAISGKCGYEIGYRSGNGAERFTIQFSFPPKIVFISSDSRQNAAGGTLALIKGMSEAYGPATGSGGISMYLSWSGNSLTVSGWRANDIYDLNASGTGYYYVAFG